MIAKYLKENTKDLHDAVEEKFQSKKIFDKSFSFNDYKKLLLANYGLISSLENQVFSYLSEAQKNNFQIEKRSKTKALEKDIQEFKNEVSNNNQSLKIENTSEALGALYLMEGLTLGGNVIAKSLKKNPEFANETFHFFGIYGDEISSMWKNFLEVLEKEVPNESQYPLVLEGVKKSYHYLLNL